MSVITTVRGDIAPDDLGYTSMHEYLAADFSLMSALVRRYGAPEFPAGLLRLVPENLAFLREGGAILSAESSTKDDVEYTTKELRYFAEAGGRSVCDLSPIGLRGDVRVLQAASDAADVHVVCSTGLYVADARPDELVELDEVAQYELFAREVRDGIDDTGIRPGLLKCGLSTINPSGPLYAAELATVRALARLSTETGLSLHVHTAFPMSYAQVHAVLDEALEEGVAPERVVMMHMDSFLRPWDATSSYISTIETTRGVSTQLARELLERGVNVGFDSWSQSVPGQPNDDDRLKGLIDLLRGGYEDRIVLGHDVTSKPQGKTYGGWGFTRFPILVPQVLAQQGFEDSIFRQLTVENPARVLGH